MGFTMQDSTKGVLTIIIAATIWGLAPIYYNLLTHVPPFELLAHRTLWSFIFFALVLMYQNRLAEVWQAVFRFNEARAIFIASFLIAINWYFFIHSVQTGQATEASLGYFMMPLVSVFWGLLIFKENLSIGQWLAVGLAALAVIVLTYGLDVPPWIALTLSTSFSFYGVIKKRLATRPTVAVTVEVLFLSPIALCVLAYYHGWIGGHFGGDGWTSFLLMLSGPLTATPLILFSYAARRIKLSTVGILQYINPSLQFICATLILLEPLTMWHAIAFPMIWIALVIYSVVSLYSRRA